MHAHLLSMTNTLNLPKRPTLSIPMLLMTSAEYQLVLAKHLICKQCRCCKGNTRANVIVGIALHKIEFQNISQLTQINNIQKENDRKICVSLFLLQVFHILPTCINIWAYILFPSSLSILVDWFWNWNKIRCVRKCHEVLKFKGETGEG